MNFNIREHHVDPADLFLPPTQPIEIPVLAATQAPDASETPAPD